MENGIIYIDKVGLEDIITFHEAGFEIIGGDNYDQGTVSYTHLRAHET